MRLSSSDPDIETLVRRIEDREIDLQPDFQRGEVWNVKKKRRLIDSVLRQWHVPPIHMVKIEEAGDGPELDVLDGQQRLAAIRDFVKGTFTIDGQIEPIEESLKELHGLRYGELPKAAQRAFNRFSIRVYTLDNYKPEEPGELFFRLNQQVTLNAAEQRNAFYGPARKAVKHVVEVLEEVGLTSKILGFSNARMAHEDVMARITLLVHEDSLRDKVTSRKLEAVYRSEDGYRPDALYRVTSAVRVFGLAVDGREELHFNKATVISWLLFLARPDWETGDDVVELLKAYVASFENARQAVRAGGAQALYQAAAPTRPADSIARLMAIFNDRATARVADVSSVMLRDLILWLFWYEAAGSAFLPANILAGVLDEAWLVAGTDMSGAPRASEDEGEDESTSVEDALLRILEAVGWGVAL